MTDDLQEPLLKPKQKEYSTVPLLEAEYVHSTTEQRTVLRRPMLDFHGTSDFNLVAQHHTPTWIRHICVDRQVTKTCWPPFSTRLTLPCSSW